MNLEVHTHKDRCLIEVDSHADSFVSLIEVDSQTDGSYGTHQCVVWVGCVGLQVIIIVGLQVIIIVGLQVIIIVGLQVMCRQRSNVYGY